MWISQIFWKNSILCLFKFLSFFFKHCECFRKRSTDMQLMAQHKYGLRVRNEKVFIELIDKLGRAAVTVDMLEVKHSRPVALNSSGVTSSSKGAAFILYNSARLETLLRTFDEKVKSGYYPELPELDQVDLSLLVEEVSCKLIRSWRSFILLLFRRKNGSLCTISSWDFSTWLSDLLETCRKEYWICIYCVISYPNLLPRSVFIIDEFEF